MNTLAEGTLAPAITSKDQQGNTVTLEQFKGKNIILYFYPKDNTPGCTTEACNLRDNYATLIKKGFVVIGVSPDAEKSHQGFISKYNLPFMLLADSDKSVAKAFGVFGPKKFMGRTYDGIHRTTFVIDKKGIISHVINKVDTSNHAAQILSLFNS